MAATVEATTSQAWATGSTTLTLTKPTGTTDGDLLVAFVTISDVDGAGTPAVTVVPSGWTEETSVVNTSAREIILYAYYKIASSEAASWSWTIGSSADACAGMVYRVSEASTITSSNTGTANNDPSPSYATGVTPVGESLLIMAMAASDVVSSPTTVDSYAITTSNPTWTEAHDLFNDGFDSTLASAHAFRTEITSTGAWSLAFSGASVQDSASILMTIPTATSVTASPTLDSMTFASVNPSISGDSNLTTTVSNLTFAVKNAVITAAVNIWGYVSKSASPTWTNEDETTWT